MNPTVFPFDWWHQRFDDYEFPSEPRPALKFPVNLFSGGQFGVSQGGI